MNLHSIVAPIISIINPPVSGTISPSQGYTTNADGTRSPSYGAPVPVVIQKQPLQYNDIVMTDGLNLQGERCKMYLKGNWNGIIRADQRGGDLITLADGTLWLVAVQAENWSDASGWTAIIATRQNP